MTSLRNQAGYQPEGYVSNAWAQRLQARHHRQFRPRLDAHLLRHGLHGRSDAQGILDAIRKRHTYGAMDNIILDVRMGNAFHGRRIHARQSRSPST